MRETSVVSSFQVNSAVVQKTCRRLCQVQLSPEPSRRPAARKAGFRIRRLKFDDRQYLPFGEGNSIARGVVVENFHPGSSLQEIFNYKKLSRQYPELIVLHISAFGDSGPMRLEPGYDMIARAAAGLMSLTEEPDGPPLKAGFAMADLSAALFGTIGIVSAPVVRARTGHGTGNR
jgi:CoA transferase family III